MTKNQRQQPSISGNDRSVEYLPYLTADLPGIQGRIRVAPEDFQVEERPLYHPCGKGEHLYLRITKRQFSTPQLVSYLSTRLGLKARSIGVAGLKDAQAVSQQMVSLHGVSEEKVLLLNHSNLTKIEVLGRHRNRLRPGHHAGNFFRLTIRDIHPLANDWIPPIMAELSRRGVPNYFGPQRQGRNGENYKIGVGVLNNEVVRTRMPRSKRMWYLNAYQSFLFNRILAKRIDLIDRLMVGDWAMKHVNGACFHVENPEKEQARATSFEISPTGPLFGSRAPWATGQPGDWEAEVIQEEGETRDSLRQAAAACGFRGERRALRVPLRECAWTVDDRMVQIHFLLPAGAYATNVLREIMKVSSMNGQEGSGSQRP